MELGRGADGSTTDRMPYSGGARMDKISGERLNSKPKATGLYEKYQTRVLRVDLAVFYHQGLERRLRIPRMVLLARAVRSQVKQRLSTQGKGTSGSDSELS
jgi:hypothetical protein